jgi:hypothetical protein
VLFVDEAWEPRLRKLWGTEPVVKWLLTSSFLLQPLSRCAFSKMRIKMSNIFDIQPIGRFVGQSAAIKRPKVSS